MVAELIEPFEPEEIFDLEQDEYYLTGTTLTTTIL